MCPEVIHEERWIPLVGCVCLRNLIQELRWIERLREQGKLGQKALTEALCSVAKEGINLSLLSAPQAPFFVTFVGKTGDVYEDVDSVGFHCHFFFVSFTTHVRNPSCLW